MKEYRVRDFMIPFEEQPAVREDDSLADVVMALLRFREGQREKPLCEQALVTDDEGNVTGRIGPLDIVAALESGYAKVGDLSGVTHSGFTPRFLKAMIQSDSLWENPLTDLCRKASTLKAKKIMHSPKTDPSVEADSALDRALHVLVSGPLRTLLVTEKGRIVGMLRFSDIYLKILEELKACER